MQENNNRPDKPLIVFAISSVVILISVFLLFFVDGEWAETGPDFVDDNAVLKGTNGVLKVESYGTYTVFVRSSKASCSETTVSVMHSGDEYFVKSCDSLMNENGWTHVGIITAEESGNYQVQANYEIAIISDIAYMNLFPKSIIAGIGLCCLGSLGLLVGLILFVVKKPEISQQNTWQNANESPFSEEYGSIENQYQTGTTNYAGFWIRLLASFIDGLIIQIPLFAIFFIIGFELLFENETFLNLIGILLQLCYFIYFESSESQATPGKMACGIIVIGTYGRLTVKHALGRYFSRLLSMITLGIGYLMIGFTEKKQGLHDKVADTYVIYK